MRPGPVIKVSRQPASGWMARRAIKRSTARTVRNVERLVNEGFACAAAHANQVTDRAMALLNQIDDIGKDLR